MTVNASLGLMEAALSTFPAIDPLGESRLDPKHVSAEFGDCAYSHEVLDISFDRDDGLASLRLFGSLVRIEAVTCDPP